MRILLILASIFLISCKAEQAKIEEAVMAKSKEYYAVEENGVLKSKNDELSEKGTLGSDLEYDCNKNYCKVAGEIYDLQDNGFLSVNELETTDINYIGNGYYEGIVLTTNSHHYTVKFSPQRKHMKLTLGNKCARIGRLVNDSVLSDFIYRFTNKMTENRIDLNDMNYDKCDNFEE